MKFLEIPDEWSPFKTPENFRFQENGVDSNNKYHQKQKEMN